MLKVFFFCFCFYQVQHKKNGGKCGVCGDPWHLPPPRPNEIGGKYGQGTIVRNYKTAQVKTIENFNFLIIWRNYIANIHAELFFSFPLHSTEVYNF